MQFLIRTTLLSLLLLPFAWGPASAAEYLPVGRLMRGESLESLNGIFRVALQKDGNLVVYHGNRAVWTPASSNRWVDIAKGIQWSAVIQSAASADAAWLEVQTDGNLVYYITQGKTTTPIWASGSWSRSSGKYYLVMQTDGNLVLYRGANPSDSHGAVWASGTTVRPKVSRVFDVTYNLQGARISDPVLTASAIQTATNNLNKPQTAELELSVEYTTENSFRKSWGMEFEQKVKFEAGLPFIGKSEIELGMKEHFERESEERHAESKVMTQKASTEVDPRSSISAMLAVYTVAMEIPFTASAEYTLPTGTAVGRYEGTFEGTSAWNAVIEWMEPVPLGGKAN